MNRLGLHITQIVLIILLSILFVSCDKHRNSISLFEEIEERYNGNWYENIRFKLSVVDYKDNEIVDKSTYLAEFVCPQQAIIKTDIINEDGLLFLFDSVYEVKNGCITRTLPENSQFLWIGMNVANMTVEENIELFKNMDFVDIDKFCTHYEGDTKYYIIGIPEYNEEYKDSNQLWFDAKTLIPCRSVKQRFGSTYSLVYENFTQVFGKGYIPQKISYYVNDELVTIQRIYDIYVPFIEKKQLTVEDFCDNETLNEKQMNPCQDFDIHIVVEQY